MSTEHFIPGKDASLEAAITRMQGQLAALGFQVEEKSWLNPIKGIWSVHVADRDCPLLYTNGKGASQLAARASALGEFFERLSCHYFWTHYHLGPHYAAHDFTHFPQERWFAPGKGGRWPAEILSKKLHAFYNPDKALDAEVLVDHNSGNVARGICALPFVRQADGETVYFPANILGNLYLSNGMSAGNSAPEARAQALAEIVERAVKFRVIREGLCLPDVPEAVLARYPALAAEVAALRAAGFGILVKDASLGGAFPVLCVALLNPQDQGCFLSFGAHPNFGIALERALTELLQGRALDALGGFPEPDFDLEEVASAPNLEIHFVDSSGQVGWAFFGAKPDFEFTDWNHPGSTQDDCDLLAHAIAAEGHDIYIADYPQLGMYACRIIVPGFSEIYPVDDLEYENSSFGNRVRDAILHLDTLTDEDCGDLLDTLNAGGIADQRPVAALIGLAPDPGTFWEDVRVGELKALLALACGDAEAIREGCDWVRHFGQLNAQRRLVYRCIEVLVRFDEGDAPLPERSTLEALYGTATLERAVALLEGRERFFGEVGPGADLAGSALHQRLLAAYAKVRAPHQGASK